MCLLLEKKYDCLQFYEISITRIIPNKLHDTHASASDPQAPRGRTGGPPRCEGDGRRRRASCEIPGVAVVRPNPAHPAEMGEKKH